MDLPDFTAYEVNELNKRSRKSDYYLRAYKFVCDYLDTDEEKMNLTEKQVKWLWGIKSDLKEY